MAYKDKAKEKEYKKKYYAIPENIAKKKEYALRPENIAHAKELSNTPERKEQQKESSKKYYARPEVKEKTKEYKKEYRSRPENKEKQKKYDKEYREIPENKAKEKERKKKYQSKPENIVKAKEIRNIPENKAKRKEYYTRPENIAKFKKVNSDLKLEVFTHYSKQISNSDIPVCACCGYTDIRFLNLDHIDSRKSVPVEEKKIGGLLLWKYIKSKGFLKGYQVLCFNCNMGKGNRKYCPHQLDKMKK